MVYCLLYGSFLTDWPLSSLAVGVLGKALADSFLIVVLPCCQSLQSQLQPDGALLGQRGIGATELAAVLLVGRTFQTRIFVEPGNLNLFCSGVWKTAK